jgi:hypothetical protein
VFVVGAALFLSKARVRIVSLPQLGTDRHLLHCVPAQEIPPYAACRPRPSAVAATPRSSPRLHVPLPHDAPAWLFHPEVGADDGGGGDEDGGGGVALLAGRMDAWATDPAAGEAWYPLRRRLARLVESGTILGRVYRAPYGRWQVGAHWFRARLRRLAG